jgi:hypothetical protein
MRYVTIGLFTVGAVVIGVGIWHCQAADEAAPVGKEPAAAGDAAQAGGPMLGPATPPLELAASTPKGQLKNPYNADIAAIAEEGHHRYLSAGCNGCHGGGGGGGMCPPLTNDTWV